MQLAPIKSKNWRLDLPVGFEKSADYSASAARIIASEFSKKLYQFRFIRQIR